MKQWFSAQELLGVASMTPSIRGLNFKANREGWQSRPRQGQGGGKEYAYASLPQGVQAALALRWWAAEVEDGPIQKARDGDPLSDQRWDAFLRLPKSQQAVGRKHMAALMTLLELERNGASRNQAIATLQSQGVVHNRRAIFRRLKSVKGHPKTEWLPLLASQHSGGNQPAHCPPDAWEAFKADYLRLEQPAASACYRRLKEAASRQGWVCSSKCFATQKNYGFLWVFVGFCGFLWVFVGFCGFLWVFVGFLAVKSESHLLCLKNGGMRVCAKMTQNKCDSVLKHYGGV